MLARTNNEIKAYKDGYNNCFNSFVEYLKHNDKEKAIEKMTMLLTATNSVNEIKEDRYEPIEEEKYITAEEYMKTGKWIGD